MSAATLAHTGSPLEAITTSSCCETSMPLWTVSRINNYVTALQSR